MAAATAGWGTGLRLVWMSRYHWLLLLLLLLTLLLFFFVVIFFALPLVILCFVCSLHSPLLHSFRRPCAYSLSSFRWFSCCRRCVATVFSSTPLTFSFVILNLTLRYSVRWYYGFERSSSQLLCLLRPQSNEATAEANVALGPGISTAQRSPKPMHHKHTNRSAVGLVTQWKRLWRCACACALLLLSSLLGS